MCLLAGVCFQLDSLQCVAADGAGAQVGGVVQADQHPGAAGAGEGRQVAGGPALDALPLVVLEVIVRRLLGDQHALERSDTTGKELETESCRTPG